MSQALPSRNPSSCAAASDGEPGAVDFAGSAGLLRCVRHGGLMPYEPVWAAMRRFTDQRNATTPDEIWLLQHPPVFTLGQAGKPEHLLRDAGIPVVRIDRGGQITYHGPGQLVAYLLIDLARRKLKVRELVSLIEQAIIDCLAGYGVVAQRKAGAPGVYVAAAKIAALGLRVRNGCSYHGLSLNVAMDLTPFSAINPCGYEGLEVVQLADLGISDSVEQVGENLLRALVHLLPPVHVGTPPPETDNE